MTESFPQADETEWYCPTRFLQAGQRPHEQLVSALETPVERAGIDVLVYIWNELPAWSRWKDGRQYVVIAAGGHGGLQTRSGDYVEAFALPKRGEP
nr:hypothetical protein [uncultured Pseudomonas sp.]